LDSISQKQGSIEFGSNSINLCKFIQEQLREHLYTQQASKALIFQAKIPEFDSPKPYVFQREKSANGNQIKFMNLSPNQARFCHQQLKQQGTTMKMENFRI